MTLKTWNFNKRVNSTKQPTASSRDYECKLKERTSIEKPIFIIGTGIDADISYCQCFGNYYFVDDIVMVTNDIVELNCTLDVLATHKASIGSYTAYVERSASRYNPMIKDSAISASQEVISEGVATTNLSSSSSTEGTYVIGVIGGYGSGTGGISVYALTSGELSDVLDFMFTDGTYEDVISDSIVKSFFNPFQYIVFLRWYPFTKHIYGTMSHSKIKFGWWSTDREYTKLNDITTSFGVQLNVPSGYYNDFRSYDVNHTQLNVELPSVGMIQLDPSILSATGNHLFLALYLDIATGTTVVRLEVVTGSAYTTRSIVGSYSGKMGASIPVGQVNGEAGSLISSATQLATGLVTKEPVSAIGGISGIIGSYNPPPSMLGTYGSRAYFNGMTACKVSLRCYETGSLLTSVYGRPLCENVAINTLSGFIKCSGASIELDAPAEEIRHVNEYLNGGFYYE